MIEIDLLENCPATDLFVVLAVKGQMSSKHEIYDNSKGPAVHTFVIWLLKQNLWGHIAQGSIGLSTRLSWAEGARQTKIDKFNF